jgi:hypothetical protein
VQQGLHTGSTTSSLLFEIGILLIFVWAGNKLQSPQISASQVACAQPVLHSKSEQFLL